MLVYWLLGRMSNALMTLSSTAPVHLYANEVIILPVLISYIVGPAKNMVPRGTQTNIFILNTENERDQKIYASLSSIGALREEEADEVDLSDCGAHYVNSVHNEVDASSKSPRHLGEKFDVDLPSSPPRASPTLPPPPPPPSPLRENEAASCLLPHGRVLAPPRPPPPSYIRANTGAMSVDGSECGQSSGERSVTPPPPPPPPSAAQDAVDGSVHDERFRLPPPLPRDESARRGKAPPRPPPPSQGFSATGNANQGLPPLNLPTVGATGNANQGFPSLTRDGLGMPMPVHYYNGQNPLISLPFPALPELSDNVDDNAF